MRYYRDSSHTGISPASVVTIGNFDGVHRGHQALIAQCHELAAGNAEVAVVTFEPQPQTVLRPHGAPPRLTGPASKLKLLREAGVDLVWMMRFNDRLASMAAGDFVETVLVNGLAAQQVVLGADFRFGYQRKGDLALMDSLGRQHGFNVCPRDAVMHQGARISSTSVREALQRGDFGLAQALLGRTYTMRGRVLRGQQLGRKLGYATANIRPPAGTSALTGIFAVRARTPDSVWRDGVANLGRRPVVGGENLLLEVHLFDFEGDLYGQCMETEFVAKIRDEENFDGLDALVAQMAIDEQQARAILKSRRS